MMVVVLSLVVVVVVVTSMVTIPWSLVVVVPIVIVVTVVGIVGVIGIAGVVGVVVGVEVGLLSGFCHSYHLVHEAAGHPHSFIKFLWICRSYMPLYAGWKSPDISFQQFFLWGNHCWTKYP